MAARVAALIWILVRIDILTIRAGRLGRVDRALRLPTLGWAAVAVNAVALIWESAWVDFLTIRVSGGLACPSHGSCQGHRFHRLASGATGSQLVDFPLLTAALAARWVGDWTVIG